MGKALAMLLACCFFISINAQQSTSTNSSISSGDVILLISPFDKDTIDELNPTFHWSNSNADYIRIGDGIPVMLQSKFTLVKLNAGQTKDQAMQQNQPVFSLFPLQGSVLEYPFSATALERDSKYAWKVEKFLNGALYNQSEVWEFYIKKPPVRKTRYIKLSTQIDASVFTYKSDDTLFFILKEDYNKSNLNLMVYDQNHRSLSNAIVKLINDDPVNGDRSSANLKSYGTNKYFMVIDPSVFKAGNYTLEGINNKRELYFLRFKVVN